MLPDKVFLHRLDAESERAIQNALGPLGWSCTMTAALDSPSFPTPEEAISILIISPVGERIARPAGDRSPILWVLGPGDPLRGSIGFEMEDFIRLPAPREDIVQRAQALYQRARREEDLRRYESDLADQLHRRSTALASAADALGRPLRTLTEIVGRPENDGFDGGASEGRSGCPAGVERAVRGLEEGIEDLLDAIRVDAVAGMKVRLERVQLWSLLEEVEAWAVPRLRGKHQEISVQVAPGATLLCGDAERLGQALRHMVEAAIEGARPGSRIEITATPDPEATGFARISVGDRDGQGDSRAAGNVGVGTTLVRAVAASLGGRWYSVKRRYGGLESRIILPLWQSRAARIAKAQAALAAPSGIPGGFHVLRLVGKTIEPSMPQHSTYFPLSPGEMLVVHGKPFPGVSLGRVRDFREPGSLARSMDPKLEVRLKEATV